MDMLEILKVIASFSTPFVVAVVGVLLLRRIEDIKATVAQQSDFQRKWADQFFETCQEFMRAVEKEISIFTCLGVLENPKGEAGAKLLQEIATLHQLIPELEVRIRRCVVFAPKTGSAVTRTAQECLDLIRGFLEKWQGNTDIIVSKMNEFNTASRTAHAEMLGIR